MATLYSIQGQKILDASNGSFAPIDSADLGGRVRTAFFSYNQTGSEATSDIIRLTKLPAGARVLQIFIANEDQGTTVTMDIGDTGDTDRLVTGFAGGTASVGLATLRRDDTKTDDTPTLGYGYRYTAETWIDATLTSVSGPTANATFRGHILYSVD